MNTVINYASGKPSNPLRSYTYVHDSMLRQPRQIAATMHKMLSVTALIAYGRLAVNCYWNHHHHPRISLHIRYKLTPNESPATR